MLHVKKLSTNAMLPNKAYSGDLGYDLYASEAEAVHVGDTVLVSTGIAVQLPEGYGAFIKDRSSIATKRKLFVVAGVIDNGYIGEIKVAIHNSTETLQHIKPGDKIAQLVLIPTVNFPVEEVNEVFSADKRGEGGFGSTGS